MSTISLVMIVKNEEEILERSVDSVKEIVDEFIIVDTGSTDGTKDIIKKYGDLHEIPFTNFVDTKNAALKLATCDYILFMDADERVIAGLDKIKEYADTGIDCLSANIIEGPANDEKVFTNTYLRARLWVNSGEWEFHGPGVHEVIMGPGDVIVDYEVRVRHEHLKENKAVTSRGRFEQYIDILEQAIEKNPDDTRAWFYLARTHKDLGNFVSAIDSYETYLNMSNLNFLDEEWQAAYDLAECWKKNGEYDKAIETCDRAIKIDPRRAEAYNLKGGMYYNLQDWESARVCYEESRTLPFPEDISLFIDPTAYGLIPHDYVSICYDRLKRYRDAEKAIKKAIELGDRYDHRIINNLAWVNSRIHMNIFMTLGRTPEDVYGGILNDRGVHGVETTYIELSHELARLGHNVYLFCACTEEHEYEGVYYIPYTHLDSYSSIVPDVIITSRWFDVLYREETSKKIIWLQDALFKDPDRPDAFARADAIVCSSRWHRQYIAERFVHSIDGKKINIIPLGIRTDLFSQPAIYRSPYKVIYSSNPDRGLYILIDMWEEITAKIPLIELVICYGWEGLQTWSDTNAWKDGVDKQKHDALAKLSKFDNVEFKGRLTKKELAAELLSSSLCLYPNNFWETFCLTALETQAAGVPMITTDMGALATTLSRECNTLIRMDPNSVGYRERFIQATVDLFNDSERFELWSSRCRDFVFSRETDWEDISKMWEQLIWTIL